MELVGQCLGAERIVSYNRRKYVLELELKEMKLVGQCLGAERIVNYDRRNFVL